MSTFEVSSPSSANGTSAAGAMLIMRQVRGPVLVGVMLASVGTTTATTLPADMAAEIQGSSAQTTAGASVSTATFSSSAIGELRRLSGLTWEQLARLFHLSRRSLHFWASGKAMAPSNVEHLHRLLSALRKIDRGSASANRAILLGVREDGSIPFDLLAAGEFERAISLLGPGLNREISSPKLREKAQRTRVTQSPDELVNALQDRIHRDSGSARAAKSVRVRGDA